MKSTGEVIIELTKKIFYPGVLTCRFVTEHSKPSTMAIIMTAIYIQYKNLLKFSQTKIMWSSPLLVCVFKNACCSVLSEKYEQMSVF